MRMHNDLRHVFSLSQQSGDLNDGFSFAALFDCMSSQPGFLSEFKKMDLCVILTSTPEFDPADTHVGSYLLDKLRVNCEVIDLTELTALSLCQSLALATEICDHRALERACILTFSQKGLVSTVREASACERNSVGCMFLSSKKAKL